MNVLVTGASGFLGAALVNRLASMECYNVTGVFRKMSHDCPIHMKRLQIEDLFSPDWLTALKGIDVVVHTAARAHVPLHNGDSAALTRQINTDGAIALAGRAAEVGVRRFIFISSIKVNGETTTPGRPFTSQDVPNPADEYGRSKRDAESGLWKVGAASKMNVVVLRPPLVYGPGVKANFLEMMKCIHFGIPMPFGGVQNQRSLIGLENLVDIIVKCIYHSGAENRTFLATDGTDVSTPELMRQVGKALGKRAWIVPCPRALLEMIAALTGKQAAVARLLGSLQADSVQVREQLEWHPPLTLQEGLNRAAKWYLDFGRYRRL